MMKHTTYHQLHNQADAMGMPQEHLDVSDDLFQELEKDPQVERDMQVLKNLSGFLYDLPDSENPKDLENLYTIIKYQGKNTLIKIGSGNFDEEMLHTHRGYKLSPLPLFVVDKSDQQFDSMKPTDYLNIYAKMMIVPNGQGVESNTEEKINFRHLHILHYQDAIHKMRKTILYKKFDTKELLDKCVKNIKTWKTWTFDAFKTQLTKAEKYKDSIMKDMISCMVHMDVPKEEKQKEDNVDMYYDLIHGFDTRELSKYR